MAHIAQKDEFYVDHLGIRRLVVKGSPLPVGYADPEEVASEEVRTNTLGQPIVDEEASKSHYERTGTEPPSGGETHSPIENARKSASSKSSGGGGSKQSAKQD